MKRRMKNLLHKLRAAESLFTNFSPRISWAEIAEVRELTGISPQVESLHGAEAGSPRFVFIMEHQRKVFAGAVAELLGE